MRSCSSAYDAAYRKEHAEEIKASNALYRLRHKEEIKAKKQEEIQERKTEVFVRRLRGLGR